MTVASPAAAPKSSVLDTVLRDAELALGIISEVGGAINPGVAGGAALADKLLSLITAGVAAHEKLTGQPLDLTQLHKIAPL